MRSSATVHDAAGGFSTVFSKVGSTVLKVKEFREYVREASFEIRAQLQEIRERTPRYRAKQPNPEYVWVDGNGNAERGAGKYHLTEAGFDKLREMAAEGHEWVAIESVLGIRGEALRRLRKEDPRVEQAVQLGRNDLGVLITAALLRLGVVQNNVMALTVLANNRCGWKQNEIESKPSTQVNNNQIVFNAPPALTHEQFDALLDRTLNRGKLIEAEALPDKERTE